MPCFQASERSIRVRGDRTGLMRPICRPKKSKESWSMKGRLFRFHHDPAVPFGRRRLGRVFAARLLVALDAVVVRIILLARQKTGFGFGKTPREKMIEGFFVPRDASRAHPRFAHVALFG